MLCHLCDIIRQQLKRRDIFEKEIRGSEFLFEKIKSIFFFLFFFFFNYFRLNDQLLGFFYNVYAMIFYTFKLKISNKRPKKAVWDPQTTFLWSVIFGIYIFPETW